jgi:hypothetical protein
MDEPRTDEPKIEQEPLEVEDLEVQSTEAEAVRGGAKKLERDGVDAQHNETLLRS